MRRDTTMNEAIETQTSPNAMERVARTLDPYRWAATATTAFVAFCDAHPALADNAGSILDSIKNLMKGGLGFVGAAMVVFGGVTIGINVHNGSSGNGAAIASGVATLVGGVIVSAAAFYFGTLDTNWVTSN